MTENNKVDRVFFHPDEWIKELDLIIDAFVSTLRQTHRPLCVLCDRKASVYPAPLAYDSPASALRQIKYAAEHGRDPNTGSVPLFAKYPEDFFLSCIGLYNSNSMSIITSKDFKFGVDVCIELADVLGKDN